MTTTTAHWDCLLEPPGLVEHFLAHPPVDFRTFTLRDGTPAFSALLDPLTTAEPAIRGRIRRLPGSRHWLSKWRFRTCFVGTTVSEYAPLPPDTDPRAMARELVARFKRGDVHHSLLVIKDLPQCSPLLDERSNRRAGELAEALYEAGCTIFAGQALAWVPIDFQSTGEYLARLSRGARRDVRRKLRGRNAVDIEVASTGLPFADPALRREVYRLYRNVYRRSDLQFDLLTPGFFDAALQDPRIDGRVALYRVGSRLIAFNLCFVSGDTLVDKYVGFEYPDARLHNLYAVSWMHNLEYAAANGLRRFVAGGANPGIKAHLGARFTFTRHAVYARNPLLRIALAFLSKRFESDRAWFDAHSDASGRPGP